MATTKKKDILHKSDRYECSWITDDIICTHYLKDVLINVEDLEEIIAFMKAQGVDENCKRLVVVDQYTSIAQEGREYAQIHIPMFKAEAFILQNLSQRILFNLYAKVRKNNHPLKSFGKKEDAIKWLNQQ